MDKHGPEHIEPSVLEEAARWQARLSSGNASDADIEQHMEWLLADPAHVLAEEHVAATMKGASEFEAAARAAFATDFAVQHEKQSETENWFERLFAGWQVPKVAAAALVAALLFVAVLPTFTNVDTGTEPQLYASTNGVRSIQLADGSRVSLFEGSEMRVSMSDAARNVVLEKGRAFFDVVSDKSKPFYVNTGLRQVRVVGTRFEVVRNERFDRVAVNEGLVSVAVLTSDTEALASEPVLIEPGVTALYTADAIAPMITLSDASTIGAWADGVLTFKDLPLSTVIASINELFPEMPLELADEKLAALPFSGTLVVSSPEKMARQLAEFMSLDVQVTGTGIKLAAK